MIVKQKVTFTAEPDDGATHYEWDLNEDGVYGDVNGLTATATFNSVRTYEIGLRILDDQLNVVDTKTKHVVVSPAPPRGNAPPEASFVFFPAAPVAGLPVTFVSTSVDPDSPIPAGAERWDLNGDGVFDEATGPSATVTFPAPGMYQVSLQVTTNKRDVASLVAAGRRAGRGLGRQGVQPDEPLPGRPHRRAHVTRGARGSAG